MSYSRIILILTFILPMLSRGQIGIMNYSVKNGLSQNTVTCIFRDGQGFLWVGTQDGLNQFDGHRFIRYRHDKEDTTSISDQYVTSVNEDGSGNLLIGTRNGLNLFDRTRLSFLRIYPDTMLKKNIQYSFERIESTASGDLIISGGQYLYHWNHLSREIRMLDNQLLTVKNFAVMGDTFYQLDPDGNMRTYRKPFTYTAGNVPDPKFSENTWICIDRKGMMWSCNWLSEKKSIIKLFDIASGRKMKELILDEHINHISFDRENVAWLSTMNGILLIKDQKDPEIFKVDGRAINTEILCTFTDNEGLTWIGYASRGLGMYNPMMKAFKIIRASDKNDPVLTSLEIQGSEILLGTASGLFRSSVKGNRLLLGKSIKSLETGPDGEIWVGTKNEGIYILDRSYRIREIFNSSNGILSDNRIHHIKYDRRGRRMIVSTINGAYIHSLTDKTWTRLSAMGQEDGYPALCGNYVLNANIIGNGDLIFNTNMGFTVLDKQLNIRSKVYSDNDSCRFIKKTIITGSTEDSEGNIWISTLSNGVYLFKGDEIINLNVRNGLSNNVVYGIESDRNNRIWVATSSGIDIIETRTKRIRHLSEQNGMPIADHSFGCFRKGDEDILYINSTAGLVIVRTDELSLSDLILKPYITSVKINHEKVDILPRYLLDNAGKSISFEFSSPCFLDPDRVIYQYRISQIQDKWIDLGAENTNVTFTNLPYGDLSFELKCAMNKEALQNAKIVTTNIKVPLPFWKNQYFLLTAVLSLIAISMFSVRRATRRIMEKKLRESEITEMIYKERERISRDLHDNLGAYAACIKNSIVGIERSSNDSFELQNLRENTDELLNALRETIWALQHESIRITAISDRFKKIVNRISAGYSSVGVEIKENVTNDVFLTPTEGVNLIRIMQESITNAMKHARCTVINVHIECSDKLLISISDNGIGFDLQKKADETYGIGNMRSRAAEAGFELYMNSTVHGSVIRISKAI